MRFVIVSGMSGAGKSTALKTLEDAGYFCVDNLPVQLIKKFADIAYDEDSKVYGVAIGIDIRSGAELDKLTDALDEIESVGYKYEVLFLDATNEVLVKRYKETRRTHPLARDSRVEDGIEKERDKIQFLKERAGFIIDTSSLLTRELKAELDKIFVESDKGNNFFVNIVSFGFKYGIPLDADLVFDVRFLPNPYYDLALRPLTGNDKSIQDFVMDNRESEIFLDKISNLLEFLIPNYIKEGRNQLVVAIGCTGGKHRSVTLANYLYSEISDWNYNSMIEHRDIEKDAKKR